jgi:hypothetical protein
MVHWRAGCGESRKAGSGGSGWKPATAGSACRETPRKPVRRWPLTLLRPSTPPHLLATGWDGWTGAAQPIPRGATYRFALVIDCGKCFGRRRLRMHRRLKALVERTLDTQTYEVPDFCRYPFWGVQTQAGNERTLLKIISAGGSARIESGRILVGRRWRKRRGERPTTPW